MKTLITIQNLKCDDGINTITSKLNKLNGISNIEIEDKESNQISFEYSSHNAMEGLRLKLSEMGYSITAPITRL